MDNTKTEKGVILTFHSVKIETDDESLHYSNEDMKTDDTFNYEYTIKEETDISGTKDENFHKGYMKTAEPLNYPFEIKKETVKLDSEDENLHYITENGIKTDYSFNYESAIKEEVILENDNLDGSKEDMRMDDTFESKSAIILCNSETVNTQEIHNMINFDNIQRNNGKFKCIECNNSFNHRGNLIQHVDAVHKKIKKFKCGECVKSFSQRRDLNRHVDSVHRKIKKFSCCECPNSFTRKGDIFRHIVSVHRKIKKYKCSMCKNSFTQKSNLIRHFDAIHGKMKKL